MEPAVDAPKAAPKLFGGFGVDTLLAGLFLLVGTILFLAVAVEPYAYTIYLAVHVVAALVWVGGDVTLTTLGIVFERRGEGETLGALGRMGAWIGTRVYTPALFVVIAFGIAMMLEANRLGSVLGHLRAHRLGDRGVVGIGFVGPELGRIDEAARTHGPDSPEVAERVKRLFMIFRFDTALLILIVIDMTAKPSF